MNKNRNLVIGIGEVLWDILPEGKKIGGAPANFTYHVSRFGLDSMVISAVGNDKAGTEIIDCLREKDVNMMIEKVDYDTGTVHVEVDSNGIPYYDIRKNVAWDNIPMTDKLKDIANRTRVVCFGSLAQRSSVSRNTINSFLNLIPDDKGIYKIFDINLRQNFYNREILCHSMKQCNILKINDEELATLGHLLDYQETDFRIICKSLLSEYSLEMIVLTCGVNGSYVFAGDMTSFMETPRVNVADTVGAGDSFTAAFISGILKNKSVSEAHRIAVNVSAYVCTQNGAMPSMPENIVSAFGMQTL